MWIEVKNYVNIIGYNVDRCGSDVNRGEKLCNIIEYNVDRGGNNLNIFDYNVDRDMYIIRLKNKNRMWK